MPVEYKSVRLACGYWIAILIDDQLTLDLKVVDEVNSIHKAQLLTYMKLAQIKAGLLINFNVRRLADGIQRFKLSFLCGLCDLCGTKAIKENTRRFHPLGLCITAINCFWVNGSSSPCVPKSLALRRGALAFRTHSWRGAVHD